MEQIPEDLLTRLQEPDERALVFNPLGLGGRMPPEQAARFQAATIEPARLAEDVPEGIRDYWERVRLLHQHGVLEYDFFSAAADLALLALEGALRRRFVDFYDGRIPVIRRRGPTKGAQAVLLVRLFEQIWDGAREWDLATPGEPQRPLPTSLGSLLAWARRVKLLPGRRSRGVDQSLVKLRNWAAHPDDYSLDYPPSVARGLCQIAEYINMLWGHPSPEGHTFKTRVHRRPHVVGISPTGEASVELRPEQVATLAAEYREHAFTVLLAADDEMHLTQPATGPSAGLELTYKPGFQETQWPCEQLFVGDWIELNAAVEAGTFDEVEDDVERLERVFFVRECDGNIDHPRSSEDLLALDGDLPGRWWSIVADGPWDAYAHVRDHRHVDIDEEDMSCPECFVAVTAVCSDQGAARRLCSKSSARLTRSSHAAPGSSQLDERVAVTEGVRANRHV
jgi:hypothetical protein